MREKIKTEFDQVWREQHGTEPPELGDQTVLLDTGLDSLGFAIIVTRLEEALGYDPFSISDEAVYPRTFREFIDYYEQNRPK